MIRPYLRDLINNHKTSMESNNNNNNNNNNSNKNNTDRAECKVQLVMLNNFLSVKSFEDTRTRYSGSKPVGIFMGSDTENAIDELFNTIVERIQQAIEISNDRGNEFTHESVALLYYYFQKIDIRKGESYIMSPYWIASKKATINPKNEKDNECFKRAIIRGLNYNKIKEKKLKKILKFKRFDTDFSLHQRVWEEFEQNDTSITLNILFVPHSSEETKLAYISNYNNRKN